ALVDGQPRLLNLKQFLDAFLRHRRELVTRRTVYELRKARERAHVLEGLAVALSNVDPVIAIIKAAATPAAAKTELMGRAWRSPLVEEMLKRATAEQYRPESLAKEFGLTRGVPPTGTESDVGYRLSDVQAQPLDEYRAQKRGGRGKQAATTKEDDFIEKLFIANTHDHVLCFSNKGKLYWIKVYEVPQGSRTSRGKPIVNLLKMDEDERIN